MKLDTHVHTFYSGKTTLWGLNRILNESYNTPEMVYRTAKQRGMDLVAITDHDSIEGGLTLADRPDVIVGCEITAVFPHDGLSVHLGALNVSESQHREIQSLRFDILELMPYLKSEGIFITLNHLASGFQGPIGAGHILALIPWVDGIETVNGTRLRSQNRTAAAIAEAYRKIGIGGSDSHTGRGIGRAYVVSDHAANREEFLRDLRVGRVRAEGRGGGYFTLASDIFRLTAAFYEEGVHKLVREPLDWRRYAIVLSGIAAVPISGVVLAMAASHFLAEQRFNRELLVDLVSRPESIQALELA